MALGGVGAAPARGRAVEVDATASSGAGVASAGGRAVEVDAVGVEVGGSRARSLTTCT